VSEIAADNRQRLCSVQRVAFAEGAQAEVAAVAAAAAAAAVTTQVLRAVKTGPVANENWGRI
jgi:hypothetical protein